MSDNNKKWRKRRSNASSTSNKSRKSKETPMWMNFYSFLHKRNRFYEEDVIINGRVLKDHNQYDIKKINIEDVIEDKNGRRPRAKSVELLKTFKGWQSDDFYTRFTNRHHHNAQNVCPLLSEPQIFKPNWRLSIGLGTASIFETNITLHHIHGFPYIPASAIKGVLRSYIITTVFGTKECVESLPDDQKQEGEEDYPLFNAEFRALTQCKNFCKIFGCPSDVQAIKFEDKMPLAKKDTNGKSLKKYKKCPPTPVALRNKSNAKKGQEHQGKITIFDAYPTQIPTIEVDIMTPHYGDYYGDSDNKKGIAPTDTMSPKPIPFLTVANTPFQFLFGSKDFDLTTELWELEVNGQKKKATLAEWLQSALQNHGIGAKTAVGYGYMNPS